MNGCDYYPTTLEEFCGHGTPVVFDDIAAFARWDASSTHTGLVNGADLLTTKADAHAKKDALPAKNDRQLGERVGVCHDRSMAEGSQLSRSAEALHDVGVPAKARSAIYV